MGAPAMAMVGRRTEVRFGVQRRFHRALQRPITILRSRYRIRLSRFGTNQSTAGFVVGDIGEREDSDWRQNLHAA
jgi:hypothetical protein